MEEMKNSKGRQCSICLWKICFSLERRNEQYFKMWQQLVLDIFENVPSFVFSLRASFGCRIKLHKWKGDVLRLQGYTLKGHK